MFFFKYNTKFFKFLLFLCSSKWALQVLTIEQNVGVKERLKQQKKYMTIISEKNSESGTKVFMVRWRQSEEEREEYMTQKLWLQGQIRSMGDDDLSVKSL